MASVKGMDPATVDALAASVEGQLAMLDRAQGSVTRAVAVSNNPLSWALDPGSLIVAPWSIAQLSTANAEITLARASARELVGKLLNEAQAQRWASDARDFSYLTGYAWRTPDANRVPAVNPWEFFGGVPSTLRWVLDGVTTVANYLETGYEFLARYAAPIARDLKNWWDNLPPWANSLKRVGRALPWVGTAASAADLASELSNDPPDWWQVTRHGVSIGLDVASVVATGTVVGAPVGLVLAGVGIVWDLGWDLGDQFSGMLENPQQAAEYYQQEPWMLAVHTLSPLTLAWFGPFGD